MSTELVIRIPGEPHAQARAKFRVWKAHDGRSGVTAYDPAKSRNWKAMAQSHMIQSMQAADHCRCVDGAVSLEVLAVFTCPKTDHRKRDPRPRRRHTKKPDADNVLKAVKDAAKGVIWLDDAQVCRVMIEKWIGAQGEAPYIEIRVRPLNGDKNLSIPIGNVTQSSDQEEEANG